MRSLHPLCLVALSLVVPACQDDTPVAQDAGPPTFPDRSSIQVDVPTDLPAQDINFDRPFMCMAGAYRPCECTPGVGGREYCINNAYEGMCRCGDAGAPDFDAADGSAGDGGAPSDAVSTDVGNGDAGLMDASAG